MALMKTRGLVIKETPYNDCDKIITLITEDLGKITVSARNARRNGSRASYGTQVLTFGEYVLFRGIAGFSLNSCESLGNFYDLASDMTRFTHAAHMLDMAADAVQDPSSSAMVLKILLYGLQALKKGRTPLLVSAAFALKLSQIAGYPPHVSNCAACGTRDMEQIYFSLKKCGFICDKCEKQDKEAVLTEVGVAKAILFVLCAENGGIFKFELSDKLIPIFSDIAFKYIEDRMEKNYKKLDLLKELKVE